MVEEIQSKNVNSSSKSRTFLDGSVRTVVVLESVAIGKGTYLPGWKWSKHVGAVTGKSSEPHIGYVISGKMALRGSDGKESAVGPGDAFEMKPNTDAWVIGDEPCVALDFECLNKE